MKSNLVPGLLGVVLVGLTTVEGSGSLQGQQGTFAIETKSRRVMGSPLVWDSKKVYLVTGYGGFAEVRFDEIKSFEKRSDRKIVFSTRSFEKRLKKEFGRDYQVTRTTDYLVVHPVKQGDYWPRRIQSIYDSFESYFQRRGVSLHSSVYPLVAVVFAGRDEFAKYAKNNGEYLGQSVIGYYSPNSNRVLMFNQDPSGRDFDRTLETIVHEVSHQAAFNRGIHCRFGDTPRWVAEGLGTLFEAPGVWKELRYPKPDDRINRPLLNHFRRHLISSQKRDWIGTLISGPRLFKEKPQMAYSSAWALTFYLIETDPHSYVEYMRKLNRLEPFQNYSAGRRLADFEKAFGSIDRLEGTIQNYFIRF